MLVGGGGGGVVVVISVVSSQTVSLLSQFLFGEEILLDPDHLHPDPNASGHGDPSCAAKKSKLDPEVALSTDK